MLLGWKFVFMLFGFVPVVTLLLTLLTVWAILAPITMPLFTLLGQCVPRFTWLV